jgi:acetamidase/formamidase
MGRAEATFVSIECPGTATIRFGLRKGMTLPTPRIEAPDRVYTIGICNDVDFHRARLQAITLMFDYLTKERGLSAEDAHIVISACVDLDFGGPTAAIVLASVPLAVLG